MSQAGHCSERTAQCVVSPVRGPLCAACCSAARQPAVRILKRFPGAVDGALAQLTGVLRARHQGVSQEEKELLALGATGLLSSRPILRRITQVHTTSAVPQVRRHISQAHHRRST